MTKGNKLHKKYLQSTEHTVSGCCSQKANIEESAEGPPALSRFNCEILPSSLAQKKFVSYLQA